MKRAGIIALFTAIGTFSYGQSPPDLIAARTSNPTEFRSENQTIVSIAAIGQGGEWLMGAVYDKIWTPYVRWHDLRSNWFSNITESNYLNWRSSINWSDGFRILNPNENNVSLGVSEYVEGQYIPEGKRFELMWVYWVLKEKSDTGVLLDKEIFVTPATEVFGCYDKIFVNEINDYSYSLVGSSGRIAYEERFHDLVPILTDAGVGIVVR